MAHRSVRAVWVEKMRCVVDVDGFDLTVDEPPAYGGTGQGPQPTDLLLASAASCFALAMSYAARKSGVELQDLAVTATGEYQGTAFSSVTISLESDHHSTAELDRLAETAQRVCYVTNTLRQSADIKIVTGRGE